MSDEPKRSPVGPRSVVIALPVHLRPLGLPLLVLILLGGTGWLSTGVTRLFCARLQGQEPICSLTDTGPLGGTYRYDSTSLGAVEVQQKTVGKNSIRYCVFLLDRIGSEREVVCYRKREDANAERDRLVRYLGDPNRGIYQIETSDSVIAYVMLVVAVAQFFFFAGARLVHAGKVRVRVDDDSDELTVRWTFLGFPRSRYRFALTDVVDVRLEGGNVYTWFYKHPEPGARLAVAFHGRRAEPVTRYLPQVQSLREGVAEIREVLGVIDPEFAPRVAPPVEAPHVTPPEAVSAAQAQHGGKRGKAKRAREEHVAPTPRHETRRERRARLRRDLEQQVGPTPPPDGMGVKVKGFFEKMLGMPRSVGVLFGGVVVYSVGMLLFERVSEKDDGTAEIYADTRCIFGGVTMLPGATMITPMRPGRHSVSVFNPDLPSKYELLWFEIVTGRTTVVHCVPTPPAVVP
jgi:hypothetical protein